MAKAQEEANQLVRDQLRVQKLAVLASMRRTGVEMATTPAWNLPNSESEQRARAAAEYESIKIEMDKLLQ